MTMVRAAAYAVPPGAPSRRGSDAPRRSASFSMAGRRGTPATILAVLALVGLPGPLSCTKSDAPPGTGAPADARAAGTPDPARGWKAIARTPVSSSSPAFAIGGRTLRLPDDLAAVARHYQTRPACPSTGGWAGRNVHVADNARLGTQLLRDGKVQYGGYPPVPMSISSLQWNENPFSNRSWQWHHHQLIAVHHLLAASAQDKNPDALDAAKDIVRSWAAANYAPVFPSPMSWNDHSTAYRLRTLLCLFDHLRAAAVADPAFTALLLQMIDSHCHVLADDAFFLRHTNHGFHQASILFWAACEFPELAGARSWLQLSRERIREEVAFMFTPEGVHVENSPSYHIWLLGALEEYLLMSGRASDPAVEALIDGAWLYAAHVLQPDGRLPLVGDTESRDFSARRSTTTTPAYQHFLYSATGGATGARPMAADAVFPRSGYAVFRDRWHDAGRFGETVYLFFKCSFLADYHRHDDDLSIVLWAYGEDWLIDSGLYDYEESHPLRRYMRSPEAHTTVVVEGARAIRRVSELPAPGSGIIEHGTENGRSFVTGRSLMYRGYRVQRRVEYMRPGSIVLRDAVTPAATGADRRASFTLLFHVPEDKHVEITADDRITVASSRGHSLSFDVKPTPRCITLVAGDRNAGAGPGSWLSKTITKIEPSRCIRIEFAGTWVSACTLTLQPCAGTAARDDSSGPPVRGAGPETVDDGRP